MSCEVLKGVSDRQCYPLKKCHFKDMCKQSDPTKSQVLFGTFSGRVKKDEAAYTKILNFAVWVSHLGRRRGRGGQFDPWTSDPHPLPPHPSLTGQDTPVLYDPWQQLTCKTQIFVVNTNVNHLFRLLYV